MTLNPLLSCDDDGDGDDDNKGDSSFSPDALERDTDNEMLIVY